MATKTVAELCHREYETGDLWLLKGRLIPSAGRSYEYEEFAQEGYALTLIRNGVVEACMGVVAVDDGIELWSAPSIGLVEDHLVEYCRLVMRLVDVAADEHREDLIVHVLEDDIKTQRWLSWLGFEDRGIRKEGGIAMLNMGGGDNGY